MSYGMTLALAQKIEAASIKLLAERDALKSALEDARVGLVLGIAFANRGKPGVNEWPELADKLAEHEARAREALGLAKPLSPAA